MSANQQTEIKLLKIYDQEFVDFLSGDRMKNSSNEGKESSKKFLQETRKKIDIFEKQILNYKSLFPASEDIKFYESRECLFRGALKVISGMHYEKYPGMFSPTKTGEITEALKLFDKSLGINESARARSMKVICYRQLGLNKLALKELDTILELHVDDEEEYLSARKEKDELESTTQKGVGKLFRSFFD